MPAKVIVEGDQKGGVGKTTTTMNLGAALVEQGYRVLMVDLDQQGSLTISSGIKNPDTLDETIYNVLTDHADIKKRNPKSLESILLELEEGMWLSPANTELAALDLEIDRLMHRGGNILAQDNDPLYALKRALAPLMNKFDYILIDCPPNLGLIVVLALVCATDVIVVLQVDYLATKGVMRFLDLVNAVKGNLNPNLNVAGILLTMADERTRHTREVMKATRKRFAGITTVFDVVIKYSTLVKEAPVEGWSILHYDPTGPVAEEYRQLSRIISGKEAEVHAGQTAV